ncbi:MAG: SusC/RagA family TonB-linked outer membrane protein [Chitinophagaceae bacterium]
MNKFFLHYLKFAFFSFLIFINSSAFAQQRIIKGTVTDTKTNVPLNGATISVKNSSKSTITDENGKFELNNVPEGKLSIVVSFVGYTKKTVEAAADQQTIEVKLQQDENAANLSSVVVVGYQSQSLRKSTAAVQVISGKEIENLPAPSFEQLLQGKVAGVDIQNFSGMPGVRNTFTVRGNSTIVTNLNSGIDATRTLSTPLFIIDGIPLSVTDLESSSATGTNFLAGININDIESIVVEKDAAATSAWGSRGANGVVVIKTKRGRIGKPQFRLSYYVGLTERPDLLRTVTGAAERAQKLGLLYDYGTFQNLSYVPQILTDSLNPSFNNATDWQNLFYQNGIIHNADFSISAGTDVFNYRIGANYYTEDGIVRQTGFSRYAFRGNFDLKITPKLNAVLNLSLSRLDRKVGLGKGKDDVLPINSSNIPSSLYKVSAVDSAFYLGQYDKIRDLNITDEASAYFQLNYDILKNVHYSLQSSFTKTSDNRDRFQPAEITADGRSFAQSIKSDYEEAYVANVLSANKSFNNNTHNLALVLTQSFELDTKKASDVYGYNIPGGGTIQVVSGVPQQDLSASSDYMQSGLLSYVAQLSYDYKSKYLINGSVRTDASSRFGANNKWGYFPAVSIAWIASEEKFIQRNLPWITQLKFRGSYGLSGTMPDDFYAPFNVWNVAQGTYAGNTIATPTFYDPNGNVRPITQPDLTWNKANQANIGMDLSLFKSRVNITVDLYRRNTINPILQFPFAFFTGYPQITYNAPLKIMNEGTDIQIQAHNLSSRSELQWTTNFNFTYNRNRLAALPNGNRSFFLDSKNYNESLIFSVGAPVYGWAQMLYRGVYNSRDQIPINPITGQPLTYFKGYYQIQPGFPIWVDVNHDGDVWSDEDVGQQFGDLVPTGDPNPKITGGLYNEFSYKNFSLGVLCTFTLGRDIINTFESNQFGNALSGFNTQGVGGVDGFSVYRMPDLSTINYWTPSNLVKNPNYQANFPSINPYGPQFYQFLPFSTMFNENGDYIKIKSITLGYNFGKKFTNKLHITGARLYSVIDNIRTFSKSTVPDPELVSPQGEYNGGAFPLPKKYTLGFEITF